MKRVFFKLNNVLSTFPAQLNKRTFAQRPFLPFYHSVSDKELRHIKHLYPVKNSKQFIADLDFMLQHFEAVDLFTALKRLETPLEKGQKPFMVLSFDDGLSEFHDIIAPILTKKGIPAINFLNTAFIDNKSLFYRYKISLLLDRLEQLEKDGSEIKNVIAYLADHGFKSKRFNSIIKSFTYNQAHHINALATLTHLDFNTYLKNEKPYLTKEQIQNLINQGFYFGAHSIDHPLLSLLSINEQLHQIITSSQEVIDIFNLDYGLFAFPFSDHGLSTDVFNQIHNQNAIDFSFGTAGLKDDSIVNHFQRIPMEQDNYSASQILSGEVHYYRLKKWFGVNKIRR